MKENKLSTTHFINAHELIVYSFSWSILQSAIVLYSVLNSNNFLLMYSFIETYCKLPFKTIIPLVNYNIDIIKWNVS